MRENVMDKVAVVTGASSGVGRAVAIRLAKEGWRVGAVARRGEALKDVKAAAGGAGERIEPFVCDVADAVSVEAMAAGVLNSLGVATVLVNSAGTNAPRRAWEVLSVETFEEIVNVNLLGTFLCARAFLPGMRERGEGTIVNVVSDAALAASPKAGPAYVASKFGARGLTQSINAEERGRGIRATNILPGDIDTPLLDKRPSPPAAEARKLMLTPEDVAECVMLAIKLPQRVIVEELLVRPR
jgi:NAD(P)-dependent dehydrogenase (short-subunit alcohol dehydrogenase family)